MSRVIGRSLEEIRREFRMPYLPARAVCVAVHEAAHATVAISHGSVVTSITLYAARPMEGSTWHGVCHFTRLGLKKEEQAQAIMAGLASNHLLHKTVSDGYDPFTTAGGDFEEIETLRLKPMQLGKYVTQATAILRSHHDLLDEISIGLLTLRADGTRFHLDESDMDLIAGYWIVQQAISEKSASPHKTSNRQHTMLPRFSPQEVMI